MSGMTLDVQVVHHMKQTEESAQSSNSTETTSGLLELDLREEGDHAQLASRS